MITYISLLLIMLAIFLASIFILKREIFSPAIIYLTGYIAAIFLAIVGLETWNTHGEISLQTLLIIFASSLSFCVGDFATSNIKIKNANKNPKYRPDEVRHIRKICYILTIILYIAATFLIIKDLNAICAKYACKASDLSGKIYYYRLRSELFSVDSESFSIVTKILISVADVLSIFYAYTLINNISKKDSIRKNIKYILPIICHICICLLQSGRAGVMKLVVSTIVIVLFTITKNISIHKQLKIIRKMLPYFVVILFLFYASLPLIGRSTESSMTDYLSAAFGCSIPSLDIAIEEGISQNAISPVDNSLYGLHAFGKYLGFQTNDIQRSLPFVEIGGFRSNTYTSSFRLMDDLGVPSMLILTFIEGCFFGAMYSLAKKKNDYRFLIYYASLAPRILDMCRDDTFYTIIVAPGTIKVILLIIVIASFLYHVPEKTNH